MVKRLFRRRAKSAQIPTRSQKTGAHLSLEVLLERAFALGVVLERDVAVFTIAKP